MQIMRHLAFAEHHVARMAPPALHEGLQGGHCLVALGRDADAAGQFQHLIQPQTVQRQQQRMQEQCRILRVEIGVGDEAEIAQDVAVSLCILCKIHTLIALDRLRSPRV